MRVVYFVSHDIKCLPIHSYTIHCGYCILILYLGMIEVLHELGIELDKDPEIDRQKWTPLMSAAHDGDLKMVGLRLLLLLLLLLFL